jgi:hypothetical protein
MVEYLLIHWIIERWSGRSGPGCGKGGKGVGKEGRGGGRGK